MAKVGKFCLAKRVKVEWLFQHVPHHKSLSNRIYPQSPEFVPYHKVSRTRVQA